MNKESEKELKIPENIGRLLNFVNNIQSKNLEEATLEDLMVKGNIPFAFSDSPLWEEFMELDKKVAENIKNYKNQIPLFGQKEKEITEKLTLEEYLHDVRNNRTKTLMKVDHLTTISKKIPLVKNILEVEKKIANAMDKQIEQKGGEFSPSKLKLIFRAFGFSEEIIAKLEDWDIIGRKFYYCNFFDKCEDLNIAMDLAYIKLVMVTDKSLPTKTHFGKCPVCACDTPKKLEDMLKLNHFELNFEILSKNDINGRRFISTPDWIQKLIPEQEQEHYHDVVFKMQQKHASKF